MFPHQSPYNSFHEKDFYPVLRVFFTRVEIISVNVSLEILQEDSPVPVTKPNLTTPGTTPQSVSSEPSVSQQRRWTDVRQLHGEQDKVKTETGGS